MTDRGNPEDPEVEDGCDIDFAEEALDDESAELFPLFAEALDPNNPKTVEEAEAEWREVLS